MAERPPSRPRVAWEENRAPQESSSPPEPHEVCVPKPLQIGAPSAASSWLALYRKEKESMQFIQVFLKSSEKETAQKMRFLETICTLCKAARCKGLSRGLNAFCHKFELAENIKALLEEEPRDHLQTAVRQQAMLAIAALSKVEMVLEGKKKSLLEACFKSVFLLPPKTDMQGLDTTLYFETLDAMDTMLRTLVLSSSASGFTELQTILQMLLTFTNCQSAVVCERAVGRIGRLSDLLASCSSVEVWSIFVGDDASPACHTEIHMPVLGQLLGHLILCRTCKSWEISWVALDALHHLFRFILQQKCTTLPEDNAEHPQRQREQEAAITSWLSLPSTSNTTMAFGKYLQPSERTDIVLVAIEAMRDSSIYDKEEASSILDVAVREPASWLTEVPNIMRCIYENMEHVHTASARHSLDRLLLLMTDQCPMEVVTSLLKLSPSCDSAALAMWDVMLSQPHTLEKVLRELLSKLQDQQLRRVFSSNTEDACIHHLALLASSDIKPEEFAGLYKVHRYLRRPSLALLSLVLRGLVTLSQRPETARKMLVLLPDIMETQQNANSGNKMKALLVFRNVIGHMKRKEASPTALQLVDKLPPLFDDQSSQLRELSICLFRDVMQTVVGNDKQQMRKNVRRSLLPLFFHMSDQSESVAKASQEALLVAAKLLKWKQLKRLTQTQQTGRIGECLLVQDRSRVEEYLSQSLPYLKDAQVTLREAAVRFIGLAARHLRDKSEEKLSEICNALQLLEKDAELSVSSLAAETMLTLRSPTEQPPSGWTLWALCCWPCKAGQK
ncbi:uncharacterized protein LOC115343976 [Aquila chrysaetos chrysaetos]|uniref:uncharacterized protein LOC115343976 n=1 Tax=Aquila chrysaetos chrysaetos TaxID=223781 RepID=UPI00117729D5|nr:uncharacterized protein LOC115343976 [Aquila chrysaetos chrysaetos]